MNQKMGTHKFRFSDIHSWLYKLKDMRRSRRKHHPSSPKHLSSADASSSRKLRDPLRRLSLTTHHHSQASNSPPNRSSSFKRKIKRRTVYKPSPRLKLSTSSSLNHRSKSSSSANAISDSAFGSSSDRVPSPSDQNYGFNRPHSIDIEDEDHSMRKLDDVSEDPSISANLTVKEPQKKLNAGIRIRANSPKIVRKKTRTPKKGIAKSFAIVVSSVDPEKDFRDSMVEMILENKMREERDLEDLLACYLSLNSNEYHDVIIKAFEKTWFHLTLLT
ncbi:hypothetical protein CARUB_v10027544mg [Capsella rubella]|uniref:Transcription repressor n=2 Tax=Capsella rubella TaxID=81985 RepID=R0GCG8_9BRAS|nr:hypothetical protein CARUB_v10027544mg [Capsella rubella]